MEANFKFIKLIDEEHVEVEHQFEGIPYKVAISLLMYVMVGIRMDLAFVAKVLSQDIAKQGLLHWTTIKKITKYLKGSLNLKL